MVTEFWYFSKLLYEEDAEGHHYTAYRNTKTLPLTSLGTLPKYIKQSSFISVQGAGCQRSDISTGPHKLQDYGQEPLKIGNGRHSEANKAPATACSKYSVKNCYIVLIMQYIQDCTSWLYKVMYNIRRQLDSSAHFKNILSNSSKYTILSSTQRNILQNTLYIKL